MAYPKYVYPPAGFQCDYQHCCPHMNGISTKAIFGTYQRYHRDYGQLWGIIESLNKQQRQAQVRIKELETENALLQAKYQALHQQQFKAAANAKAGASRTPATQNAAGQSNGPPRKRGAPRGHPGWFRPRQESYDHTIEVAAPTCCPHCQNKALEPSEKVAEHCVEDIIIVQRPTTTLFRHGAAFCPQCQKTVIAAVTGQPGSDRIGPTAKSTALYLRHVISISYRKTQQIMQELFGMKYAVASALTFDEQAAHNGKPLYEDLQEKLRATAYVHADETHWREDGQNGYVWFAGNPDLAFYHIDRSRAGKVAADILGEDYGGTLVADAYQGYNAINPKDRQSCLAHLIRKCDAVITEIHLLENAGEYKDSMDFCAHMRTLFQQACAEAKSDRSAQRTPQENETLEQILLEKLEKRCATPLSHPTAEAFRKRLLGKEKNLCFAFLRHAGVPPTNNHAEQSIRPMVIMRKTSFGTRSPRGSQRLGIIKSLVQTAKRQRKDIRPFLKTLLTHDTASAQKALYRNNGDP